MKTTTRILAYDVASFSDSVRNTDENGYLHVDISNVTKEQVAPYRGDEIPHYRELGFEADEIYHAYRPASELSKPETVNSLNGIPILLEHHPDSAEAPAKEYRVGATGTDAEWKAPYLTNSLHIQDADAIRRINDGTMKELSLGYFYTPIRKEGEFKGEHYDFVMTDISCNHVALVEKGRAGADVMVHDSALEILNNNLPLGSEEDTSTSTQKEIENMATKEELLKELLDEAVNAGLDPEKVREKVELITKAEEVTTEDEGEEFAEGVKYGEELEKKEPEKLDSEHESEGMKKALGEDEDEQKAEDEEGEKLTEDEEASAKAFDECGLDEDMKDAFNKGFAAGVVYGEEKEKDEPKHLDELHESEGEKRALGEDSAKKIADMVKAQIEGKYNAIEECEKSLGKVRASAFDSADHVYMKALIAEGVNVKDFKLSECRSAYRALMTVKDKHMRASANDSAKKASKSALSSILSNVKLGE